MPTKKANTSRTKTRTSARDVFLRAAKVIKKHEQADGVDWYAAARDLQQLLKASCGHNATRASWAICSALWAESMSQFGPELDDIHENCRGGELFLVAYFLGRFDAAETAERLRNKKGRK